MAEAQSPPASPEESTQEMNLPQWTCKVETMPKSDQFTVGEIFDLICEGPKATFLSADVHFEEEGQSPYRLRVLEVLEQTDNKLSMKATSYLAQPHKFEKTFIVEQGKKVVQVEPFQLQLKSVITQPQQKPFGPMGPLRLAWPNWLWISLAVLLVLAALYALFTLRRRSQMRRVLDELKQHNTALGAFNQFNKDVRLLGRQYVFSDTKGWSEQQKSRYLENLDEIFRMYLLREFYVPALEWNSALVVKTLSKQDKNRFVAYGPELKKLLKELDRAKDDVDNLQVHDCKQLTQMAKKVTQSIWKVRK